jgi:hypothetical protein
VKRIIGAFAALLGTVAAIVVGPVPAASAAVIVVATDCTGDRVPRCAELRYDNSNHVYRAWGLVKDRANDSDNYDVDVMDVFLNGVGLEQIGWHPDLDNLSSGDPVACHGRVNVTFAAVIRWRNVATGATDSQTLGGAGWVC